MSDQNQAERVCKALGIEGKLHKCSTFDIDIPAKTIYPTGSALLEALKGKLREDGIDYAFRYKADHAPQTRHICNLCSHGEPIFFDATELDALLAACEKAFCGEVKG